MPAAGRKRARGGAPYRWLRRMRSFGCKCGRPPRADVPAVVDMTDDAPAPATGGAVGSSRRVRARAAPARSQSGNHHDEDAAEVVMVASGSSADEAALTLSAANSPHATAPTQPHGVTDLIISNDISVVMDPAPPPVPALENLSSCPTASLPLRLFDLLNSYPTHAGVGTLMPSHTSSAAAMAMSGYAGLVLQLPTPTVLPTPVNDATYKFVAEVVSPYVRVDASIVMLYPPLVSITSAAFQPEAIVAMHSAFVTSASFPRGMLPPITPTSAVLHGVYIQPPTPGGREVLILPQYSLAGNSVIARMIITLASPVGTTGGVKATFPTSDERCIPPTLAVAAGRPVLSGCDVCVVHPGARIQLGMPQGGYSVTLVYDLCAHAGAMALHWRVNAHVDARIQGVLRAWAARVRNVMPASGQPTRLCIAIPVKDECPAAAALTPAKMLQWLVDDSRYRRFVIAARAACAPAAAGGDVPMEAYLTTAIVSPRATFTPMTYVWRLRDGARVTEVIIPSTLTAWPGSVADSTLFLTTDTAKLSGTLMPVLYIVAKQGRMLELITRLGIAGAASKVLQEVVDKRRAAPIAPAPRIPESAPADPSRTNVVLIGDADAVPTPRPGRVSGTACINEADVYRRLPPWLPSSDDASVALAADVAMLFEAWKPSSLRTATDVNTCCTMLKLTMATDNVTQAVTMLTSAAVSSSDAFRGVDYAVLDRTVFACVCYFNSSALFKAAQDAYARMTPDAFRAAPQRFDALLTHVCGEGTDVHTAARDPAFSPALSLLKRTAASLAGDLGSRLNMLAYAPFLASLGQCLTVRRMLAQRLQAEDGAVLQLSGAELSLVRRALIAEVRAHLFDADATAGTLYSLGVVGAPNDEALDDGFRPEVCHALVQAACADIFSQNSACVRVVDLINRLLLDVQPGAAAKAPRVISTMRAVLNDALEDIMAAVADDVTNNGKHPADELINALLCNAPEAQLADVVPKLYPMKLLQCIEAKDGATPQLPLHAITAVCNRIAASVAHYGLFAMPSSRLGSAATTISAMLEHVDSQPPSAAASVARTACSSALSLFLQVLDPARTDSNRAWALPLLRMFIMRHEQLTLPCVASWLYTVFESDVCCSTKAGQEETTQLRAAQLVAALRSCSNQAVLLTPLPRESGPQLSLQALVIAAIRVSIDRIAPRQTTATAASAAAASMPQHYTKMPFPCTKSPPCSQCVALMAWMKDMSSSIFTRSCDVDSTAHVQGILSANPRLPLSLLSVREGNLGYTLKKQLPDARRATMTADRNMSRVTNALTSLRESLKAVQALGSGATSASGHAQAAAASAAAAVVDEEVDEVVEVVEPASAAAVRGRKRPNRRGR